jgi:two-component system, NarL family, sensor histidine kinase DesK
VEFEERQVRAARRFGRLGLLLTGFWLLAVPLATLWLGWPGPFDAVVIIALYVAALVLHVHRMRQVMRSLGTPAPRWFQITTGSVGLALALYGLISAPFGYAWALVSGILLGDIVGGMPARRVAAWVASSIVAVFGLGLVLLGLFPPAFTDPATGARIIAPGWYSWLAVGLAAFYVASLWFVDVERLWWLKAVTDMDDSRRAAADLATARERLRLADDLHDILGHALEVVAFKSELATRLLDADPVRARAEMDEVQRVARTSLSEVRALVHDARATDLATELAGARAVLASAGIALDVHGDPESVDAAARSVFGRVLREGMTNLLRHAQPSRCTIDIGPRRLRIVNDGVPSDPPDTAGSGLAALDRYLAEHAGRLEAGPVGDGTFRLCAEFGTELPA